MCDISTTKADNAANDLVVRVAKYDNRPLANVSSSQSDIPFAKTVKICLNLLVRKLYYGRGKPSILHFCLLLLFFSFFICVIDEDDDDIAI